MNFDPIKAEDYRPGVGVVLMNHEGKVFVAQRIDFESDAWQMPQGGIDNGERPLDSAFRELEEEIGVKKEDLRVVAESDDWYYYDLPDHLAGKLWGGRYIGQMQKWYLMYFTGPDERINIQTEHPEFKEWKWEVFEKTVDSIVPFKKDLYRKLVSEFQKHITSQLIE